MFQFQLKTILFNRKVFKNQYVQKNFFVNRMSMKNYSFENKFLEISDFTTLGLKMSLVFNVLFNCLILLKNSKQF